MILPTTLIHIMIILHNLWALKTHKSSTPVILFYKWGSRSSCWRSVFRTQKNPPSRKRWNQIRIPFLKLLIMLHEHKELQFDKFNLKSSTGNKSRRLKESCGIRERLKEGAPEIGRVWETEESPFQEKSGVLSFWQHHFSTALATLLEIHPTIQFLSESTNLFKTSNLNRNGLRPFLANRSASSKRLVL